MSLVLHEYYAMSSKLYFLQTDRKNHLLTFFFHESMQILIVYLLLLIWLNFN